MLLIRSILFLCATLLMLASVSGEIGVDFSQATTLAQLTCMKQSGNASFVIPRVFRSVGLIDGNGAKSIIGARTVNISHVDGYIFPCPTCTTSGYDQVVTTAKYLDSVNSFYAMLWLDVEAPFLWSANTATNRLFFQEMLQACVDMKLACGIYSSASQWNPIMGAGYQGGGNLPLWYAHYDNDPSFDDFVPFGGWTVPSMKQYAGNVALCGVTVDLNFSYN